MKKLPVVIIIQCPNCESTVGFISAEWVLKKRHTVMCLVCEEKFYVAFTIKPVSDATETPMPDYVLRSFNDKNKNSTGV